MKRLQLELELPELTELYTYKTKLFRSSYIYAMNLLKNDADIQGLITGDVDKGKGNAMLVYDRIVNLMLRKYGPKYGGNNIRKFEMKRDIICKPMKKDINDLFEYTKYNCKGFDDAYLNALNLESNKPDVIYLGKAINVTRSHNNFILFCYQKITRATKLLMERFNIWMHKPTKEEGILYARSQLFQTDDPWNLEKLLKSSTPSMASYWLLHNPNLVTTMKFPNLKVKRPALWERYQKLKHKGHNEIAKEESLKDQMRNSNISLMNEVYELIQNGIMAYEDVPEYLRKEVTYNEIEIRNFLRGFTPFSEMKKTQARNAKILSKLEENK